MASPISNFVRLTPGVQVRLHFTDHKIARRQVTDPDTKRLVEREGLMFFVDKVDGIRVDKMYSILSERHSAEFAGYLPGKAYVGYEFIVVKDAPGYVAPRIAQVLPA